MISSRSCCDKKKNWKGIFWNEICGWPRLHRYS